MHILFCRNEKRGYSLLGIAKERGLIVVFGNYSGQPLRFGARRASVLLPFTLSVPVPAALSLRTRCFG
jgi:hypothetical protein